MSNLDHDQIVALFLIISSLLALLTGVGLELLKEHRSNRTTRTK